MYDRRALLAIACDPEMLQELVRPGRRRDGVGRDASAKVLLELVALQLVDFADQRNGPPTVPAGYQEE
jgi:hypothetical protein